MGEQKDYPRWVRVTVGRPRVAFGVVWTAFGVTWLALAFAGVTGPWSFVMGGCFLLLGVTSLVVAAHDKSRGLGSYAPPS